MSRGMLAMGWVSFIGIVVAVGFLVTHEHALLAPLIALAVIANALGLYNLVRP